MQIQFMTTFSAEAFSLWLQKYYSDEVQILCNTSKLILKLDAEPFTPKKQSDFEEEKFKTIERMYHYYNYTINGQN